MTVWRAWLALLFVGCATGTNETTAEDFVGEPASGNEAGASLDDGGKANTAEHGVNVALAGSGEGMVVSNPPGLTCPAGCSAGFTGGTTVTLTATPKVYSNFAGWTGGGCAGSETCVVTASGQVDVTATFTKSQSVLSVSKAGTGTGAVTSAPVGIDCGITCAGVFDSGTTVTLTAAPSTGSTFTGWSGGCTGTSTTCQVAMTAQAAVVATFTLAQNALTVTKSGTGAGTVTSTPAGISCGATCGASFAYDTSVTLAAVPAAGSTFAGWSGSGCSGVAACTVSMTAVRGVTATFNPSNVSCTTVNTANSCTNAVIAEINLGGLSSSACHDECQTRLRTAAVATGCWLVALNGVCYCRGGVLSTGGSRPGGSCN